MPNFSNFDQVFRIMYWLTKRGLKIEENITKYRPQRHKFLNKNNRNPTWSYFSLLADVTMEVREQSANKLCKSQYSPTNIPAVRWSRQRYASMIACWPIIKIETLAAPCKQYISNSSKWAWKPCNASGFVLLNVSQREKKCLRIECCYAPFV
jgi:hypothetical protein